MILLVAGGREYSMRAYDWLRLDALNFRSTLPPVTASRLAAYSAQWGEPSEDMLAEMRGFGGPVTALYEGEADGADTCARAWAESRGIPVRPFAADWKQGKSAGPRRNALMLQAALLEATSLRTELTVVLFPGGTGTADMAAQAAAVDDPRVGILDYRGGPAQRWTADDVRRAEGLAGDMEAGGDPSSYAWRVAIAARWAERGAVGMPLVSAHLLTDHGRVHLPPAGACYIGRFDHRNDIAESPLANPFRKTEGVDAAVLLERYRSHLRAAYKRNLPVQRLLHSLDPWTLLVCWCHADRPCHGTIVADAAMQVRSAAEMKAAGRELPAAHWTAYRQPNHVQAHA